MALFRRAPCDRLVVGRSRGSGEGGGGAVPGGGGREGSRTAGGGVGLWGGGELVRALW